MKKMLQQAASLCCYLLVATVILTGCNKEEEEAPRPTDDVIDIIAGTDGLDSLYDVVSAMGLSDLLSSGKYTIFAPNNAAFQRFVESTGFTSMYAINPSYLQQMILYHIVPNDLLNVSQLDSVASSLIIDKLTFTRGDSLLINKDTQPNPTSIVRQDLQASNGVIHVINEILLPGSLRELRPYFGSVMGVTALYYLNRQYGGFSSMARLLFNSGLAETLNGPGPYTVLAPLDALASFNYNPNDPNAAAQIASRYLLDGKVNLAEAGRIITTRSQDTLYVTNYQNNTYLNGIYAVNTGVAASNGNVMLLAGTLQPPITLTNAVLEAELYTENTFNIFKTAMKETGLQLGKSKTIFIPSDAAFEAAGLVSSIDSTTTNARISPEQLNSILQTHVINGVQFDVDIAKAGTQTVNSLNETPLTFTATNEAWTISSPNTADASLIYSDVLSEHGVVHFINKVLKP